MFKVILWGLHKAVASLFLKWPCSEGLMSDKLCLLIVAETGIVQSGQAVQDRLSRPVATCVMSLFLSLNFLLFF